MLHAIKMRSSTTNSFTDSKDLRNHPSYKLGVFDYLTPKTFPEYNFLGIFVSLNFIMNILKRNLNLCTYCLLSAFFLLNPSKIAYMDAICIYIIECSWYCSAESTDLTIGRVK